MPTRIRLRVAALPALLVLATNACGASSPTSRPAAQKPTSEVSATPFTATGLLFEADGVLRELSLTTPQHTKALASVGSRSIVGLATDDSSVYAALLSPTEGANDQILAITRKGGTVRTVATGISLLPSGLVVANGYLYWPDTLGIGRVSVQGNNLDRSFISLPAPPADGGIAGLTSDGKDLFFGLCSESSIGRVPLAGGQPERTFLSLPDGDCPQYLTESQGWIYWPHREVDAASSSVGRANPSTGETDPFWFKLNQPVAPDAVAVDSEHVYWSWRTPGQEISHVGRVDLDRQHSNPTFAAGPESLALLAVP